MPQGHGICGSIMGDISKFPGNDSTYYFRYSNKQPSSPLAVCKVDGAVSVNLSKLDLKVRQPDETRSSAKLSNGRYDASIHLVNLPNLCWGVW